MSSVSFFRFMDDSQPCLVLRGMVNWLPNKYTVKILKESSAYEGEMTFDSVSEYCQSLNLSVEEYIDECKLAFKTNLENNKYSFSVDNNRLNVRKRCETQTGSSFKIILCTVLLEAVNYSSAVTEVLDSSFDCCGTNSEVIDALTRQTESLRSDNRSMVIRLEEMVTDKLLFERVLYEKFVNLLNSKKKFGRGHQTSISENDMNVEELQPSPCTSNMENEAVFDVETDCDEASDVFQLSDNDPSTSTKTIDSLLKSSESVEVTNRSTPSVENILNSLAFLDPLVSFSNK